MNAMEMLGFRLSESNVAKYVEDENGIIVGLDRNGAPVSWMTKAAADEISVANTIELATHTKP